MCQGTQGTALPSVSHACAMLDERLSKIKAGQPQAEGHWSNTHSNQYLEQEFNMFLKSENLSIKSKEQGASSR